MDQTGERPKLAFDGHPKRRTLLNDALGGDRRQSQMDFADALLATLAEEMQMPVASLDLDLDRFSDVTRFEQPQIDPACLGSKTNGED